MPRGSPRLSVAGRGCMSLARGFCSHTSVTTSRQSTFQHQHLAYPKKSCKSDTWSCLVLGQWSITEGRKASQHAGVWRDPAPPKPEPISPWSSAGPGGRGGKEEHTLPSPSLHAAMHEKHGFGWRDNYKPSNMVLFEENKYLITKSQPICLPPPLPKHQQGGRAASHSAPSFFSAIIRRFQCFVFPNYLDNLLLRIRAPVCKGPGTDWRLDLDVREFTEVMQITSNCLGVFFQHSCPLLKEFPTEPGSGSSPQRTQSCSGN